ncbi:lecithin retinol acyltransferase family protein [Aeromonas sp. s1(2024)]|uniref:lecithin retinol acyltransferase family protein n=1 Tax=Aeromonas TaxID=642 RepID=UPI0034A3982F
MSSLNYGDHLISPRIGYEHHGIYVGNDWVIHYQGPFSGHDSCQVVMSTLGEFCQEKDFIIRTHPQRLSPDHSVNRAHSRLGERSYNLLFNNCEHFVMWCIKDLHHSPQVTRAAQTVIASQVVKASVGKLASTTGAGLTGAYVSSTAATSTAASLVALGSVPAWAPLALGAAAAYGAHKLWNWLTD